MEGKALNLIDLDRILSLSPIHIYWLDDNNIYQGCNEIQAITAGLKSRNDVVGKKNKDLPYNKGHTKLIEILDKTNLEVIRTGEQKIVEEEAILLDGSNAVFLSYKVPLKDKHKKVIGLLGMSINITSQKNKERQLKEEKEYAEFTLEHIISYLPAHIYWKNKDGVYLGSNESQAKSLGLRSTADIIGKTDYDLPGSKENADRFRENDLKVMQTGLIENIEEESIIAGTPAIMLSQKIPLKDKNFNISGVVGISIDITERKKTEKELILAKGKAESADRAKTEFLRNMRHDFRTPFSGILGMASILQEQEEDPNKKELLGDIANSAQILLEQLNEIADFISLEEGEIPILDKQFDLHQIVTAIKRLLLPSAKNKNLKLNLNIGKNIPKYVIGDKTRTYRILINLLTNSIKFTKDGEVSLSITIAKIEDQKIVIRFMVKDTGVGFSAKEKDIIFTKFSRLTPSYTGIYTGKGLGLRIVKQFLDEVGGEIHVESKIDNGSTFVVLIPYKLPLLECNEKELINNNSSL